jgi:hypothetical protein
VSIRREGSASFLWRACSDLEVCKKLGEETIVGYLVQARRHSRLGFDIRPFRLQRKIDGAELLFSVGPGQGIRGAFI